jgi:hypothetical protein
VEAGRRRGRHRDAEIHAGEIGDRAFLGLGGHAKRGGADATEQNGAARDPSHGIQGHFYWHLALPKRLILLCRTDFRPALAACRTGGAAAQVFYR